jgi:VanZ family protein
MTSNRPVSLVSVVDMTALKKLDPWAPPLVLMAVIFFFSAQPNLSSGLGWIDHVGRKFVHASEYALLCFLWWRALRTVMGRTAALLPAWIVATLYAVTDEFHQTFVTGRHGTWVDVAIDSLGAGVFALLTLRAHRQRVAS